MSSGIGSDNRSTPQARRQIAELRSLLLTLDEASDDEDLCVLLREALSQVRVLLDAELVVTHSLEENARGYRTGFAEAKGVDARRFARALDELMTDHPVKWGLYNPGRPEPSQRNRVLVWTRDELEQIARSGRAPAASVVYPATGLDARAQARTLLCDGPSLLAWFSVFQPRPIERRQVALLREVLPALRRRLLHERVLSDARKSLSVSAALDRVVAEAFIVSAFGRIVHANAGGARALKGPDGSAVRSDVERAVLTGTEAGKWMPIALESRGVRRMHVVVARREPNDIELAALVSRAATRWNLTPRQRDVLSKVAEGNANRTIAAMLGISARTVEIHLTALIDKAQVENRTELVAKLYAP